MGRTPLAGGFGPCKPRLPSGLSLPVIWALMFAGAIEAPTAAFSNMQWHAHEMFFGFGWAMLGGFLLTSTKNWVKIRGYHGNALVFLAAAA
jgi:uncharacterized protein involved in response to NO